MTQPVAALVARLGLPHDPPDPLFTEALTHASSERKPNYERLEFLGDAVLKLVVSRWLFEEHRGLDEGEMTKVRAHTVSDETLAKAATTLQLGAHLILGSAEKRSGGRLKTGIIASAFEALLGAIFLTAGEIAADTFLREWLGPEWEKSLVLGGRENSKALLQELTQGTTKTLPTYRLADSLGPAHDRRYVIEVSVDGVVVGRGEGSSKKSAEQAAATAGLATLAARGSH